MKTRKLLLTATCLLMTTLLAAQTPELKWVTSQDGVMLEIPDDIKASADGNVFLLNHFASSGLDDVIDIGGHLTQGYSLTTDYYFYDLASGEKVSEKTCSGAADLKSTSGNTNMTLYKTAPNGHLLWTVYTSVGYCYQSAMAPLPDGGVMLVLKMRHTSQGSFRSGIVCRLVDDAGTQTNVEWDAPKYSEYGGVYQPVLVRISKDGKVEWTKRIDVGYKTVTINGSKKKWSDNFSINDLTADAEGNVYICGIYRTTIDFGAAAKFTSPHNMEGWDGDPQEIRGDFFAVKLNGNGEALWGVTSQGGGIECESPRRVALADGKLYVSGYTKGDGQTAVQLGGHSLVPTDRNCLFYASLNTADGTVNWARVLSTVEHPETKDGGQVKPMCMAVSGNSLYMGGSFRGNVKDGDRLWLENANESTMGLLAFVLKCDATNGSVQRSVRINGGLTEVETILPTDDKLLIPGYALVGASYLYTLDLELTESTLKTYTLKSSPMTVTIGGALVGNILVSAMSANRTATFPGCDWTLNVINNGDTNYRACVFTGHDISSLPTGIAPSAIADKATLRVYGGQGSMIVEADTDSEVQVYGIDGCAVALFRVAAGSTEYPLPTGFYIVNGQKIVVR